MSDLARPDGPGCRPSDDAASRHPGKAASIPRADQRPFLKSQDIPLERLLPFGYAPGGYTMKCPVCCAQTYDVDKRAFRCWQCAVNAFRFAQVKAASVNEVASRSIGRDDIVDRLRKAYGFLRDEGHFVSADACLVALTEIQTLRAGLTEIVGLAKEMKSDKFKKDRAILVASQALRANPGARADAPQGIEARSDETRSGSAVGESPVAEGHAPNQSHTQESAA